MASRQSSDIRALLGGGADEDRAAVAHFLVGAAYLVIGGVLALLALLSLNFAEQTPLPYGRIESMANTALMLGFGVSTLAGGIYYVLPRLTGARLANLELARVGPMALAGLVGLAILTLGFGLGDGLGPLGLAWWMDLPLAATATLPALITISTIKHREEKNSYVTVWFVLGGSVWLALLYWTSILASLPLFGSITTELAGLFFNAGYINMWLLVVGFGLFYYTIVKELDVPLASRQLALVGFWSMGFAAAWWGASQLIFGPGPDWLDGVAAALGLALPIGALANAANFSLTLEDSWRDLGDHPGIGSGVLGSYLAVVVAGLAAFGSFPAIGSTVALTSYWEGIEYAALLGVGPLLAAAVVFPALPRAAGRKIPDLDRVRSFRRATVTGSVGVMISLVAAGIYSGYSWIGGSNGAAYVDIGEGWAQGSQGAVTTLLLAAAGFGIVALVGHLAYAAVVFGTITTGKAVEQEVLVTTGASDE